MIDMIFDVGDQVIIKKSMEEGIIQQCRYERYIEDGELKEKVSYSVSTGKLYNAWCTEDEIRHLDAFNIELEVWLLDLMIDTSLKINKPDVAKELHQEKLRIINKNNK